MGTTSVYYGIAYVFLIPSRLPVLLWAPSTNNFFFKSTILRTHTKSWKNPCRFKNWIGFVGQISWELLPLGFSYVAVCPLRCNLCKYLGGHSVTTEPCSSPHFTRRCLWCRSLETHWSYLLYVDILSKIIVSWITHFQAISCCHMSIQIDTIMLSVMKNDIYGCLGGEIIISFFMTWCT